MQLIAETLTPVSYNALRAEAGLPAIDAETARQALNGSLFSVAARDDAGALVGMGRVVGDGALYVQLVDVIVSPSHRETDVASGIVAELIGYVDRNVAPEAQVIVLSDVPSMGLYQASGFKLVYPDLYGMARKP